MEGSGNEEDWGYDGVEGIRWGWIWGVLEMGRGEGRGERKGQTNTKGITPSCSEARMDTKPILSPERTILQP